MNSIEDISILIVTHNHQDYIGKLIDSLSKNNYFNVFICDASSNDDTLKILKKSPFENKVLSKSTLESYSKNNNDLIRHFGLNTKYYLLLNPDTFFDEDFIEPLFNVMESNPTIGISAPLLKYPDGEIQITWKKFPNFFTVLKKRVGFVKTKSQSQMDGPNIDWCLGACMLISKNLLKKNCVLLDERYRLYCEDIDICFEAHSKGYQVIGVQNSVLFHHLNEASSKMIFSRYNYWNITSIIKFILKWNFKYWNKLKNQNMTS